MAAEIDTCSIPAVNSAFRALLLLRVHRLVTRFSFWLSTLFFCGIPLSSFALVCVEDHSIGISKEGSILCRVIKSSRSSWEGHAWYVFFCGRCSSLEYGRFL
jgi:hypothetical protein